MIACVIMTQSLSSHGLTCISHTVHSLSTSTLGVKYPFHHLTMWWRWGRGSFALTTVCLLLPWVEIGEGLIYIIHRVSPSTLGGGGDRTNLNHTQCYSICVKGEGLICILYNVTPSTWDRGVGEGLICIVRVSSSTLVGGGGGAHLHPSQFLCPTSIPGGGEGLICIVGCLPLP